MVDEELLRAADGLTRERLSQGRYVHVTGVADTAEDLALRHGLPQRETRLAALLHDLAREYSPGELLEAARSYGIEPDDFAMNRPMLLHGPVAAEVARDDLGVEDPQVLQAVRVHTTGAPEIGRVAVAVYVADKIEPGRDYPSVERMRELSRKDLYKGAASILRATHAHNENEGKPTHPDSEMMLSWLESL